MWQQLLWTGVFMLEWLGRVGLVELTVRLFQEIVRNPDRPEREVTLN